MTRHRIGFYDTSKRPSGQARYVESLLGALDRHRFEPVLFGVRGGPYGALAQDYRARFVDVRCGPPSGMKPPVADRTRLPARRVKSREGGGTLLKRITRIMLPEGLKYRLGFEKDVRCLAAILHRYPVDLFHTSNTGCEEAPLAARRAGYPIILGTFHVLPCVDIHRRRDSTLHRRLERRSNQALDFAIAVSDAARSAWMARSDIDPDRVLTIRNGIEPDRFCRRSSRREARARLGIPDDGSLVIGSVGNLRPVKGFEYLIKALAILRANRVNVHLVLAGDGPEAGRLRALAHRTGALSRVHFLGFRKDVQEVFDALDLFVLSSLSESLSYVLQEAMATELPCIATDVGGVGEVVVSGETGYLIPPRNAEVLADAIAELGKAPLLREQMGRAGRERVLRYFNEADMVRRTIEVYESLLAQDDHDA